MSVERLSTPPHVDYRVIAVDEAGKTVTLDVQMGKGRLDIETITADGYVASRPLHELVKIKVIEHINKGG